MPNDIYKHCNSCNTTKLSVEFTKCTARSDGLQNKCKSCAKKYRITNKVKSQQYHADHYQQNKLRYKQNAARWQGQNVERCQENWKNYYKENKEYILKRNEQYNIENIEQIREYRKLYMRKYRRTHQIKVDNAYRRYLTAKRRCIKKSATPRWCDMAIIREIYEYAAIKSEELITQFHVDHYYPLQSELVCGLHVPENLQIITKEENLAKGNKHPEDFYGI
jgi:hypothetical protein